MRPSARVLDLFAVPDTVQPLAGGQGRSVRAGDLVLSPDRHPATQEWLSPLLARLAVDLDQDPTRARQDLRIAVPVPARDGSWVVEGWAASRYEPGTVTCRDLEVTLAAGRLLHARLATAVPQRPSQLDTRDDRWAEAERVAFGEAPMPRLTPSLARLTARITAELDGDATGTGHPQLVHADLAGNVLLDAAGAPVVIDVAPAWRPATWAEAVCVLDSVVWAGADPAVLGRWTREPVRTELLRAIVFRLLSDDRPDVEAYAGVLSALDPVDISPGP